MLKKVLVANRGEIACRAIRTCRDLGIKAVAVYSVADKESLHVQLADEAYCIGSAQAKKSYLDIPSLLTVAKACGADAVYPGYGFLAENAGFADACVNAGLVFIGPSAEAIEKMGDKAIARKTMQEAGVSIVPGTKDLIEDEEEARRIADSIGYPVLIKATAGGGGKGMRVVESSSELVKALRQASSEAERSFGNKGVYLEKYLTESRHVEIQIMADNYGNVVYLGERDCSTQRRHQKLLEEAPSPVMDEATRKAMGEAAVAAAKAVNYSGAGTVEFIVDDNRNFYFMEMNTRIQVEHPITEQVIDYDLIREQILLASGVPISGANHFPKLHSIECRINAEDPFNEFRPSPGKITELNIPGGHGIRVDTHVYSGYTIPSNYDSMIAKLITTAQTREEAIAKMKRALEEFYIEGIKTTIPFHRQLMEDENYLAGNYTTKFMEDFKIDKKYEN